MAVDASGTARLDPTSLVQSLIKRICRGFYEPKHAIVVDIILKHSIMRDDHIALLMGLQNQEVRKLCGRLREDRILTMHNKLEVKPGQTRPINRTYYFVVMRDAVDAIKFKMHKLVRTVEEQSKNDFDSKGYICPFCKRKYSALDVLPFVTPDGQAFACGDCSTILEDDRDSMENRASQERLGRLRRQTEGIISTLKQIDESVVPVNDFVTSSANAIPPSLDMLYTPQYPHGLPSSITGANGMEAQRYAVHGGGQTTSALGVSVDFDGGAAQSEEARRRKLQQSEMNQLPEWHLKSTVSGDWIDPAGPAALGKRPGSGDAAGDGKANGMDVDDLDAEAADDVASYYKMLKEQQARERLESEDEMDDDDGSVFEDVMPTAAASSPAAAATPASTAAATSPGDDSDESGEFEDVV
ncbi:hypothetical protein PYCC9005_001287 [Savitreella phatthalungensis]